MNILHYLNVLIGFSLVMLILSIVTSVTAQMWLVMIKAKARGVGNGLVSLLNDVGVEKSLSERNINDLLNSGTSIFGKTIGRFLNKISIAFLAGSPKNIGREEFVLLLLRKAKTDQALAEELRLIDVENAAKILQSLEKQMLTEETQNPNLPYNVWRTKAMQAIVPDLSSKIFARFDEVMYRVDEEVNFFGKQLSLIITIPLLLLFWPVDSITLFNRLNNDQILSAKVEGLAEGYVQKIKVFEENILKCKQKNDSNGLCDKKEKENSARANAMLSELNMMPGLFGETIDEKDKIACNFFKDCKLAKPTPGIFITWILISLGSAFWLGVLNKMLGIRSEFSKKLEEQREIRSTSQQ